MNWRWILKRQRGLLRDLILILVVSLVVGTYFLERLDTQLRQHEERHLRALAGYLAVDSGEYLATNNRISLNVIAREAAGLDTVETLIVRDLDERELASAGLEQSGPAPVRRVVRNGDGDPLGRVDIWPTAETGTRPLETGFVLAVLLLLALRVLGQLIYQRLPAQDLAGDEPAERQAPDDSAGDGGQAWMRVSIINFDHMETRYTASLLAELLADYQDLLHRVAGLYGARLEASLGQRARLVFAAGEAGEAAFNALCAGQLFLQAARRLGDARKRAGRTALQFKVLVTTRPQGDAWSLCTAGGPGRVHMPEEELVRLELDTRVLYQVERCLVVSAGEQELRLQPVEQLAQRYQKLIGIQTEKLLAGQAPSGLSVSQG